MKAVLYSPGARLNVRMIFALFDKKSISTILDNDGNTHHSAKLFLYMEQRQSWRNNYIPTDLRDRLFEFVPPLSDDIMKCQNEMPETIEVRRKTYARGRESFITETVPLIRRDMDIAAAQDLISVLQLVDSGRVSVSPKTSRATAATARNISNAMYQGDFFDLEDKPEYPGGPIIGPIRGVAWPLLLQAGKFVQHRGSKLELTRAGRSALSAPPEQSIRKLWDSWDSFKSFDEFSRIDIIKGQKPRGRYGMTSVVGRRYAIKDTLMACPSGNWINFDEFSRYMRANGIEFEVTGDPWKLYVGDLHYGTLGYRGYHSWTILQDRYMLCFLFEYAATLGIIDIAYTHPKSARRDFSPIDDLADIGYLSRYDGLQYIRLTQLGEYCFGIVDSYKPRVFEVQCVLTVYPDRRVEWSDGDFTAGERALLEKYSTSVSNRVWRIDGEKTVLALESGGSIDELRTFLARRDPQPLPETVEGSFRNLEYRAKALVDRGSARVIECVDVETAQLLSSDVATEKICKRFGERSLLVKEKSIERFRQSVRKLGYGFIAEETK